MLQTIDIFYENKLYTSYLATVKNKLIINRLITTHIQMILKKTDTVINQTYIIRKHYA